MNTEDKWLPLPAGFKMSPERRPAPLELKTFQDWSDSGYMIMKGSKSVGRGPNGVPLFSSEQVAYTRTDYVGQGEEGDDDEYDPDLPGNPEDYGDR